MLFTVATEIKQPRGPKPEFPGLNKDAEALGVSRYFLWKVLKGYATSAPLMKRYRALKVGAFHKDQTLTGREDQESVYGR